MLGGSSLQKSTATVLHRWVSLFSMGHPCCLLCSVGHPCIGGCRHVWWVILADARSQQRLSSIGGCRCSRWIILAVFCARWVILGSSLLSVALGGSSSIEMCRHARCRSCGDDRSLQRLSSIDGCRYICIIFDLLFNVIDSTDLLYNLVAYWQNIFYNLTDLG